MKQFLIKLFNIIFGLAVDTAQESASTLKTTLKFWSYLSIALGSLIVLAILLYAFYAMIF